MSNLADIIAQETQDGRLIVRFLLSAMDGNLPDFQPCHRIDAARLLVKLGFDHSHAQAVIDRARADRRQRTPNRDSRSQPQAQSQRQPEPESQSAANSIRARLAQIVREETEDGFITVCFLIDAMQGQFPDFKPGHRLSAAKELLQRGFDYLPDDPDAPDSHESAAQPEPDPAEIEAQRRRAEDIEFSKHGPVWYKSYPYPCVCEDRLHDCKGNVLDDQQLEKETRKGPGMQSFIGDPDRIDDFLARYADYLTRWNPEHPRTPIDINRIHWHDKYWQHLNPARGP